MSVRHTWTRRAIIPHYLAYLSTNPVLTPCAFHVYIPPQPPLTSVSLPAPCYVSSHLLTSHVFRMFIFCSWHYLFFVLVCMSWALLNNVWHNCTMSAKHVFLSAGRCYNVCPWNTVKYCRKLDPFSTSSLNYRKHACMRKMFTVWLN